MSLLLSACMLARALRGNIPANRNVKDRLRQASFTFVPCNCTPKCKHPTQDQIAKAFVNDPDLASLVMTRLYNK